MKDKRRQGLTLTLASEHDFPKYMREKKTRAVTAIAAQVAGLAQVGNSFSSQAPVRHITMSARTRMILSPHTVVISQFSSTNCWISRSVRRLLFNPPQLME